MQSKVFLRTLSTIHTALSIGLLLFIALAYWQTRGFKLASESGDIFVYIVPTLAMFGYFVSKFIHRKLLGNLSDKEGLSAKLSGYQAASLVQYALIEGPALIAIFAYFQSGTALYLVIALALLLYLYAQRPTRKRILEEMPLSFEEKKLFDTFRS